MQVSVRARVATLFVITTIMSVPSSATTFDLRCRMAVPKTVLVGGAVPLKFEISNHSKKAVNVLTWNTPMEGFLGRFLRVTGSNGELEYGGPMMKRGAPERSDYARIKAGASIGKTVDLAEVFKFSAGAVYRVEFIGQIFDVTNAKVPRALEHHTPYALTCPNVAFSIQAEK